jgi:hypothetical protein
MKPHETPLLARDTSEDAQAVQIAIFRSMNPAQKVALVEDANRTSRALALTGLRSRHPGASTEEIHRRLMDLILGPELAEAAYGPLRGE